MPITRGHRITLLLRIKGNSLGQCHLRSNWRVKGNGTWKKWTRNMGYWGKMIFFYVYKYIYIWGKIIHTYSTAHGDDFPYLLYFAKMVSPLYIPWKPGYCHGLKVVSNFGRSDGQLFGHCPLCCDNVFLFGTLSSSGRLLNPIWTFWSTVKYGKQKTYRDLGLSSWLAIHAWECS